MSHFWMTGGVLSVFVPSWEEKNPEGATTLTATPGRRTHRRNSHETSTGTPRDPGRRNPLCSAAVGGRNGPCQVLRHPHRQLGRRVRGHGSEHGDAAGVQRLWLPAGRRGV